MSKLDCEENILNDSTSQFITQNRLIKFSNYNCSTYIGQFVFIIGKIKVISNLRFKTLQFNKGKVFKIIGHNGGFITLIAPNYGTNKSNGYPELPTGNGNISARLNDIIDNMYFLDDFENSKYYNEYWLKAD